jgi:hypothetical protein
MKKLLLNIILMLSFINLSAQEKNEEQIITAVKFETDKIILNNKPAFNYNKLYNYFTISDLNGKELITGDITALGKNKFSSVINFVTFDKKFSNAKIIGRNELIFALCENNVFTEDFKINEEKLTEFFEKYNELK